MSIVTPIPQESTVTLYKGIPWDSRNENVRLFKTEQERHGFFNGKAVQQWLNCSIVKKGKSIRLEGDWRRYLNCNYMSFTNGDIGAKPTVFYCYISSIEYVNVNAFEIEYEIDWIQTYILDFVFETCFVEREHVSDDTFGRHTLDENLDTGEYVVEYIRNRTQSPSLIMYFLQDSPVVSYINRVITCLTTVGFKDLQSMTGAIQDLLQGFADAPERVVMLCMGGDKMVETSGSSPSPYIDGFTCTRDHKNFKYDNQEYMPKNNKTLCYPYKFMTIDNYSGQSQIYRWEEGIDQVGTPAVMFQEIGAVNPKPTIQVYPLKYKGWQANEIESNAVQNFAVTYDNFPLVPFATDAYRAWVSQYGGFTAAQMTASVVGTVIGAAGMLTSNIKKYALAGKLFAAQSAVEGAQGILGTAQQIKERQIHSVDMHGSVGSSSVDFSMGRIGFRETQYGIRPEYAKMIDEFFTRYGYRVDSIKVPEINSRRYCNYVKTKNSHVAGDIAVDAKEAMELALDSGVTFWHTNDVGMELESNPIVGG